MSVIQQTDSTVRVRCQKCDYPNPKAIRWLRKNSEMFCDGCHAIIALENSRAGFQIFRIDTARHRLQQALAAFDKSTLDLPIKETR